MRIAMVAPPFGQTGGPEVVVQNLTAAFAEMGVDFTLFAPADWDTPHALIPTLPASLWNMPGFKDQSEWARRNYIFGSQTAVLRHAQDFDIIHLHSQRQAYPVGIGTKTPTVVTLHSPIDRENLNQLREANISPIGLTHAQVGELPIETIISNGIPTHEISPSFAPGEYLLAVGRLTPYKGVHVAIQIAKKAGKKLIIIGRIGLSEDRQEYFKKEIQPHIDGKQIVLIESLPHEEMYDYYRKASFLLFPLVTSDINPLSVIEALTCGTPVLGTTIPPLPEMLSEKSSTAFFLSDDIDALAEAAAHPERFSREVARAYAEEHFDSRVMAKKYLDFYKKVIAR